MSDFVSYKDQIKDPRWQKKRLDLFDARGWSCESCGRGERTLHAHHMRYVRGRSIWEYELSELKCLCEDCHANISFVDKVLQGKHENPDVNTAVHSLKETLGFLFFCDDSKPEAIISALEFLNSSIGFIDLPSRFDLNLHEKPVAEITEITLNGMIEHSQKLRNSK